MILIVKVKREGKERGFLSYFKGWQKKKKKKKKEKLDCLKWRTFVVVVISDYPSSMSHD